MTYIMKLPTLVANGRHIDSDVSPPRHRYGVAVAYKAAMAAEIVRRCNAYDEMVAALHRLVNAVHDDLQSEACATVGDLSEAYLAVCHAAVLLRRVEGRS